MTLTVEPIRVHGFEQWRAVVTDGPVQVFTVVRWSESAARNVAQLWLGRAIRRNTATIGV